MIETQAPQPQVGKIRNAAFPDSCPDAGTGRNPYTFTACAGNPYTDWQITPVGDRGFQLRNIATGLCVDGGGSSGDSYLIGCDGGENPNLRWIFEGDAPQQLRNIATGLCLDSGGVVGIPVYTFDCAAQQRWTFGA